MMASIKGIFRSNPKPGSLSLLLWTAAVAFCVAPGHSNAQPPSIDYAEPALLVGKIFAIGPLPAKCLFKSERRGTRNGDTVRVTCDYTYPDGSLAARDRIVYEAGRLDSFEEAELQTAEKGTAIIRADPKNPGQSKIFFEYVTGKGSAAKTSSASETLANDTLVDDMIPAFIVSHWAELEKGLAVKFRYIVLSRKETIGFKLMKESESARHGQQVVRIKMEPTSFIIAQLVDPLVFVVDKAGKHHILEYIGRTTPLIRDGSKWKDLDATSIFDWTQELAETGKLSPSLSQ